VNYLKKPIFEMHEFPEHLAALGHTVGFVQFPEGESRASLAETPFKRQVQGRVLTSQSLTLYTPKTLSGGFIGRLLAVVTFKRDFKKIVRDFEPDAVVSFTVPTSGWQAVQVCKKLGIPLVFRALDVSHKIRKSPLAPLIKMAEKYIYKNADWVSANNPAMLDYCLSLGAQRSKGSVELPPLNISHFRSTEEDTAKLQDQLEIPNSANVCLYMGSFFYFSGLPELISSFATDRKENEYLVLVGGGEQEAKLRNLTAQLEIDSWVRFVGFVSFEDLPLYLSLATVAVNPMHRSVVSNAAFPNKVIQYMAAKLPVVSTRLDGLVQTFGEGSGLVYVDSSDDVYQASQKHYASLDIAKIGEGNLKAVKERFSINDAVKAMELRLEQLIGTSS
jgi:glycosyltransferase involved in cell wall biosynthesis|tara:strand:+ start:7464 stop:8630 length:1167 start_codon:yes stop_codon:yes gene_type:complete